MLNKDNSRVIQIWWQHLATNARDRQGMYRQYPPQKCSYLNENLECCAMLGMYSECVFCVIDTDLCYFVLLCSMVEVDSVTSVTDIDFLWRIHNIFLSFRHVRYKKTKLSQYGELRLYHLRQAIPLAVSPQQAHQNAHGREAVQMCSLYTGIRWNE